MPGEVNPNHIGDASEMILKPCAYCQAQAERMHKNHSGRDDYAIYCRNPKCGMKTPWVDTQKEADVVWNRRAPDPEPDWEQIFSEPSPFLMTLQEDERIEAMKRTLAKCRGSVIEKAPEPGTSVVRWVRYDGTPETLPKSNVIDASYASCLASIGGGTSPVQSFLFHPLRESWGYVCGLDDEIKDFRVEIGDVWCYWTGLPEPPEDAK